MAQAATLPRALTPVAEHGRLVRGSRTSTCWNPRLKWRSLGTSRDTFQALCRSQLIALQHCNCQLNSPASSAGRTTQARATASQDAEVVPVPVVLIDQHSEPHATVVDLEFGDRLGALLDTMAALKELGLNVIKGRVTTEEGVGRNRFVITQNGEKVQDPGVLEAIRGTIISNLLQYHPESKERLAMARGTDKKASVVFANVPTKVLIQSVDNGSRSELYIETVDYPGLLLDVVNELKYLSIDVSSAEIDTEGLVAKDHFYVSYRGKALDQNMITVTKNTLVYFLDKREIEEEESY